MVTLSFNAIEIAMAIALFSVVVAIACGRAGMLNEDVYVIIFASFWLLTSILISVLLRMAL